MKTIKKRIHIVESYLLSPTNPIRVNLIGAGGTGSQMLTALARINHALNALGHAGLAVRVFENDTVERHNLARQLFTENEIGLNKGVALINRINRFFGTDWKALPQFYNRVSAKEKNASITISCVDTLSSRIEIAETLSLNDKNGLHRDASLYLLDLGNSKDIGQVVLSTVGQIDQPESKNFETVGELLPITEEYRRMMEQEGDRDETPSCSLAEALGRQDLFINSVLANMAASLLWRILREGIIEHRGFFLSLGGFKSQPIAV